MTLEPIPLMLFDTSALPQGEGHAIWVASQSRFYDLQDPDAAEAFSARINIWNVNGLILTSGEFSGDRLLRTARRARSDGFDHYTFLLHRRGQWLATNGDHQVASVPGRVCAIDFARPILSEVGDNDSLTLTLPRDFLDEVLPPFDLHCLSLDGVRGSMLYDFLQSLPPRVGQTNGPDAPHLAQAIRHMVAACLSPSRDAAARAQSQIDGVNLHRAKQKIDAHLHLPEWGAEQLAESLRLSRSTLYRIFAPYGGVAECIRERRLARAHVMLADRNERRSVGEIALRCGFQSDTSFSRAFRQAYGYSPREARSTVQVQAAQLAQSGLATDEKVLVHWINRLRMPSVRTPVQA
jgi:AraC-like DNA-binding protein